MSKSSNLPNGQGIIQQTQLYQGPLPPPEQLEGFEKVHHGAAERIIRMAENEQNFRHEAEIERIKIAGQEADTERRRCDYNFRLKSRQLWLSTLFVVISLVLATIFVFTGHEYAGTCLFIGSFVPAIISAFFKQKGIKGPKGRSDKNEDEDE